MVEVTLAQSGKRSAMVKGEREVVVAVVAVMVAVTTSTTVTVTSPLSD